LVEILHPSSVEEAIGLLSDNAEALPLAGGNAIQILRRQGLLGDRTLVDLAGIDLLQQMAVAGFTLWLGAMLPLREVERSAGVWLLCEAYRRVGNVRVRNTATVGGNLAHGDYRLDPPAARLVLGAEAEIAGPNGYRTIPVRDFFVDLLQTALGPAELLVGVRVPLSHPPRSSAFVKFSSLAANDWPCVSVAAALEWEDDAISAARVGVTCMAATPLLVEVPLGDGRDVAALAESAARTVLASIDPIPDIRGSVQYKRRVCEAIVRDAIARAWRAEREPAVPSMIR
jgi:carbon-monoxide dehydrogenase medium subunit